jgi:hypothetical protein
MKNIVNRLDDLSVADHKVDDVNKLIFEQERKIKQLASDYLSFLSYIGVITTGIVMIVFVNAAVANVKETVQLSSDGGRIITIVQP